MHAVQQILNTVQAVLAAGGTPAGTRVFLDRIDPVQAAELPAILIDEADSGEQSQTEDLDGTERRELRITIVCLLAATTDAVAIARTFGLAIEKLIASNAGLKALSTNPPRLLSSRLLQNGEGDRLFAGREHIWLVDYCVFPAAPDVIL